MIVTFHLEPQPQALFHFLLHGIFPSMISPLVTTRYGRFLRLESHKQLQRIPDNQGNVKCLGRHGGGQSAALSQSWVCFSAGHTNSMGTFLTVLSSQT